MHTTAVVASAWLCGVAAAIAVSALVSRASHAPYAGALFSGVTKYPRLCVVYV